MHVARFFILSICSLSVVSGAACRRSQPPQNSQPESAAAIASLVPPYSTREPERYQATRIIKFIDQSTAEAAPQERISRVLIARDGERRREEYLDNANEHVVYLEIPAGQFVLLPSSSLYADLTATPNESGPENESAEVSPDLLLNQKFGATYENLGPAMLEGRMTAKYRVIPAGSNNDAAARVETLIWIDESLGLPVRSEITSIAADHSSKVLMELKDIKLEADKGLFALPSNYRKVEARLIFDRIHAGR